MAKKVSEDVRDDINFLEYPTWVVSRRGSAKVYVIEKENGRFTLSTAADVDRLPGKRERTIFYQLLSRAQRDGIYTVRTTMYELKKSISADSYKRVRLALERLHGVSVKFEGVFYDGNTCGHRDMYFHFIDTVDIKDDNTVYVRFNREFVDYLKNSNYFQLINLEEYRRLKRPVSARLYEILVKNFRSRKVWQVSVYKLRDKLALDEKYPSDIVAKVKGAVGEICEKTALKINFNYRDKMCMFNKLAA